MKKWLLIISITLLTFSWHCSRQKSKPVIARIGDTVISTEEFKERYEFTPHIGMTQDETRNRRQFLISLLGEKVLAAQGYKQNLDKQEPAQVYTKQMEKEAIVEELFRREITSKIQVSQQELKQAYVKSKEKLHLQVLTFENAEDARTAKQLIKSGQSFTDVKRSMPQQAFIDTDSVLTLSLSWGDAHPAIEAAAYALKLQEVSPIVEVDGMHFIIKLVGRQKALMLTEHEFYQESPKLKDIIRERKSASMFDSFLHDIMKGKALRVPHEVFNFVVDEMAAYYPIKENSEQSADSSLQRVNAEHLNQTGTLGDHWDDPFVTFADSSFWTIGQFLKNLTVGPYQLSYKSKPSFRASVRRALLRMVEFENMAQRGYEMNLHKTDYVKSQTHMWRDSYIAQLVKQTIIDTVAVSDEEAHYFYDHNSAQFQRPELLKIREIVVKDKSLAIRLLHQIRNGAKMATLARTYSIRADSRSRGGVAGFYTKQAWGDLGDTISKLQIGELAGPLMTSNNEFVILRLIDRKPAGTIPFDDVKSDAHDLALSEKRYQTIDNYTTKLSNQLNIELFTTVFDSVETHGFNMYAFKRHYPGRSVAPLVAPLLKAHHWQNKMDILLPKQKR